MITFDVYAKLLPECLNEFVVHKIPKLGSYCFVLELRPNMLGLISYPDVSQWVAAEPEELINNAFKIADLLINSRIESSVVCQRFFLFNGNLHYPLNHFLTDVYIYQGTMLSPESEIRIMQLRSFFNGVENIRKLTLNPFESVFIFSSLKDFHRDAALFLQNNVE